MKLRYRDVAGALLLSLSAVVLSALASDQPAFVDERQPSLPAGMGEARATPTQDERRTRVILPRASESISHDRRIPVAHVNFRGGTVFPLELLATDLQAMLGREVTVGELVAAVEAITRRYQQAGYPLSYAYLPSENFVDGVVTVVLVEGYIARTELEIGKPAIARRVANLAERIVDERPLTRETFERYTALMERIPGTRLAISAPVPRTPSGATTLRVEERDSRSVTPALSVNGGSEDEFQLLASLAFQANTPQAERLSFAALLPLEGRDEFYAAEYQQELGSDGVRLTLAASYFDTEERNALTLGQLGSADEQKVTERYRLGLDYPLLLSRQRFWSLGAQVGYHHQRSRFVFDGDVPLERELHYSSAELNSHYRWTTERRLLEWRGELRRGVDFGGNRSRLRVATFGGEVRLPQPEELEFNRFGLQGRWVEQVSPRWRLGTRLDAFWSDDRLPSPERGNYGGLRFGRGYAASQAEGDYGVAGELELRYLQPLSVAWANRIEPYLVLDGARTGFNELDLRSKIASAALGLEVAQGQRYRMAMEYAEPIGDRDRESESRDGRVNLRVSWQLSE